MLAIPEPLLSEEGLMVTGGGEEEEGVVSDPGTEIMSENDSKVKVHLGSYYIVHIMQSAI